MNNQKKLEEMEPWIVKADKEIAAKLFEELKHPKGLGDTYAGDVMREAAERIEHLAEGQFKLDFSERFPHWNPIKCKMLCWVWPKIWRSDDQEFLKSLEWGACVLNGEYVRAQKLHDGLRTLWDSSAKHPSGIRGQISHEVTEYAISYRPQDEAWCERFGFPLAVRGIYDPKQAKKELKKAKEYARIHGDNPESIKGMFIVSRTISYTNWTRDTTFGGKTK